MRFLLGFILGLFLSLAISSQGELIRVRVKVLNASEVSDVYLQSVIAATKYRYRDDLGIRMRSRVSVSDSINHEDFILLEDRFDEFKAYKKILKKRPYWNRVTFVAVPPYYDSDGRDYGTGLSSWFALGVVRDRNWMGEDRFNSDWTTLAHEVAHLLGASHTPLSRTDSIMHIDALRYADNGLRFLSRTKREIWKQVRKY